VTSPIPPLQSLARSDFWFNSKVILMHKRQPIVEREMHR
jgi:hypothetical protein